MHNMKLHDRAKTTSEKDFSIILWGMHFLPHRTSVGQKQRQESYFQCDIWYEKISLRNSKLQCKSLTIIVCTLWGILRTIIFLFWMHSTMWVHKKFIKVIEMNQINENDSAPPSHFSPKPAYENNVCDEPFIFIAAPKLTLYRLVMVTTVVSLFLYFRFNLCTCIHIHLVPYMLLSYFL
jgi:hypothetical protein